MSLSEFATRNLKAILFVTVALCLVGVALLLRFPVAILPDITFPRIVILADAGDRPIRSVEAGVTRPLEEAVATVPNVQKIRSQIERGATSMSIDFGWGTDMATALQLVNTKVAEARSSLPPDTKITAERMNPTVFPVYGISLHSRKLSQSQLWTLANYALKPELSRVPGVARIVVQGGAAPEIAVDVDPQKLAAYKLSLPDVEQAMTQTNVIRAVGRFDRQFQQYEAIVSGETTTIDLLGATVVSQKNALPITLRQIATIRNSAQDRTTVVTADGEESVLLNVVRQPDGNTIAVAQGVQDVLKRLKPTLPAGTEIGAFYNQAILVNDAVSSVRDAVLLGAALSVVVLMLFLGNLRATFVTALIIPATVLITFLLMRLAGLSLNLMTLGALAVGIGLVIDDAIVVVENVFRHLAGGVNPGDAVALAAKEISAPMISSTLTTVVVFLPLVLVTGVAGAFFTALAITLVIALMVSLALALFVSPSLCAAFLKVRVGASEHGPLFARLIKFYDRILRFALRGGLALPVIASLLIVGVTVFFGLKLKTGLMPEMDEGAFILDYTTPTGTSLAESDRLLQKIETILYETPEVAAYSRRTGTELGFAITEPNRGDFAVMLKENRKRRIDDVIAEVRGKIHDDVAGVDVDFSQVLQDLIGDLEGAPKPVEIKLFGDDAAQINALAAKIGDKLGKIKGVVDMKTGVIETGPELVAQVDPIRAGRMGLTPDAVATQINAAMFGDIVTQVLQNGRQVGVRVRYPAPFRSDKAAMMALPIRTPGGANLPLSALAEISEVPGAGEVNRENQRRMVAVSARLEGLDLGTGMKQVQAMMKTVELPPGVTVQMGGQFEPQQQTFQNFLVVLAIAIVLVYAVMMFQFGSFTAPTVILLVMPLSLFGVVASLYATDTALNVSSFMGAIMLVGIVVKNGILLLDQAQQGERSGMDTNAAIIHAGEVRLRPILMTTLTAILGLVPLALGLGAGAEMQQPLAIAVIGGLSFSTIFTLLFAPLLYAAFRRKQTKGVGVRV